MTHSVLLIEDDPTMAKLLVYILEMAGYETQVATNGESGLDVVFNGKVDMLLLDVMLPGELNGYEILKIIRRRNIRVPIMLLTARSQESEIVMGLEAGADDYMTKPFNVAELLARIATVIRRSNGDPGNEQLSSSLEEPLFQLGNLVLPNKYEAIVNGSPVHLRPKEFEVLFYLLQRPGIVVHREELMTSVWGVSLQEGNRTVDVHVSSLRKRLQCHQNTVAIEPVRGVGYKLVLPVAKYNKELLN